MGWGRGASWLLLATIASLHASGTGSLPASSPAPGSRADEALSLKEDLKSRTDLAVSCCPWREAAGGLFSVLPVLQFLPPCGSAQWFLDPDQLSLTPSCAEGIQNTDKPHILDHLVDIHDNLNKFM